MQVELSTDNIHQQGGQAPHSHSQQQQLLLLSSALAVTETSMSTSAALLPQEVLVQILQHVPLNNRFSSCALVSTAWAAAACAATDTVSLKALSDPERLTAWLRMHGPQVSSICIRNGREKALQLQDLPCSRLCDLQLGHFELDLCAGMTGPAQARAQGSAEQLGQGVAQQMAQGASQWPAQCTAQGSHTRAQESAHTTQPGAAQMPGWGSAQGAAHGLLHARGLLQAATGLTSLVLASCSIGISQQQFAPLAKLTTLEHLELDNVTKEFLTDDSETDEAPAAVLRAGVLRPLTRLTHLTLDWMRAGKAVQQDLSCLVNLRELSICLVGSSWRLVSQLLLPVGLTHLWLENYSHRIFDAHTLPGFDNLTALQELSVKDCQGFDAALLGGKTKMQGLVLDDTELEGDDSAAVFLGSLSDMQDLQVLKLSCALCDSGFGSARQPMEQYVPFAALTASTNLTYWEAALEDIPPWAWAYIWNPERPPYLNLTTLKVHLGTDPEEDGYPPYAIPRDCVRRLALCCPAVESFTLSWPQSLKLDLAPLKQLTGLTKLCLESIHSGKEPLVYSDSDSDFDDLPLWQHLVWR